MRVRRAQVVVEDEDARGPRRPVGLGRRRARVDPADEHRRAPPAPRAGPLAPRAARGRGRRSAPTPRPPTGSGLAIRHLAARIPREIAEFAEFDVASRAALQDLTPLSAPGRWPGPRRAARGGTRPGARRGRA